MPLQQTPILNMESKTSADVRLRSPFTCVVAGPTGSGKSQLLFRLIRQSQMVAHPPPSRIIYYYGSYQKDFENVDSVHFHEEMIDVERHIPADGNNRWLIVDDLMEELSGKQQTNNLFTQHSHHKNISVFLSFKTCLIKRYAPSLSTVTIVFSQKNPRDATTVSNLAKQMFPGKTK